MAPVSADGGRGRRPRSDTDEHADRFVTQRQAAELCGCSKDTVIRARLAGRLPDARLDGQTWTVPVGDLVAAGLYDPDANIPTDAGRPPRPDTAAPTEATALARAEARVAALEDLVARQDDELAFLRQLTADTLGRRAG